MKNYCDICDEKLVNFSINNQVFSHLNFKNILDKKKITYQECKKCNLFYNKKRFNNKIFKSIQYSKSNQTSEKIFNFQGKIYTRSEIQAIHILKLLNKTKNPNILDIGSFDGKLLFTINKKIKKYKPLLFGFDINKSLQKNYNNKVKFISNLNQINDIHFDLIILSHSIMYLEKINEFMNFFKKNLKNNGKIFVQCSNLEVRPYNLYLADQYFFPTKYSLNKIFKKYSFKSKEFNHSLFNNEISIVFSKEDFKSANFKKKSINSYLYRNEILKQIIKYKTKDIKIIYIFGTTLEAAIAHSLFNKKEVLGFIDENKLKQNIKFRGFNVFHPNKIDKCIKIFFPYNNHQLKMHLIKKYKLNLI